MIAMTDVQQAVAPDTIQHYVDTWGKMRLFIVDQNNLLILFLFAAGLILRNNKRIENWLIVYIIPLLGVFLGALWMGYMRKQVDVVAGGMIGFVYGCLAITLHNMLYHTLNSPIGISLMKLPLVQALADMIGVEAKEDKNVTTLKEDTKDSIQK